MPVFSFSLKEWKSSVNSGIREEAQKSFSELFRAKVKIGQAGGKIVGQIILKDIQIEGYGTASEITLDFDPLKYAYFKGDIVRALKQITVNGADLSIVRQKDNKWNFSNLLPSSSNAAASPPPFAGNILIKNSRVEYADASNSKGFKAGFAGIYGKINIDKKSRINFALSAMAPDEFRLDGAFTPQKYHVRLAAKNISLSKWANYFSPSPYPIFCRGSADISLIAEPKLTKGTIVFSKAEAYRQNFSGNASFSFDGKNLISTISRLAAYQGTASGKLAVAFWGKEPKIDLALNFSGVDLASLVKSSPGIEGKAKGKIKLAGTASGLTGELSASLFQGKVLGQPVENASASFKYSQGIFGITDFRMGSKSALFHASGKVYPDLTIDLSSKAEGIRLSGQGILGKMGADITSFSGSLYARMDAPFWASPLKNLSASGEVILTNGEIGQQKIDYACGSISIGKGLIRFSNTYLKKGESLLLISGQTGIGAPTDLKIASSNLHAEDLKIINHFLPPEIQNLKGAASFEAVITGFVSKETDFYAPSLINCLRADVKASLKNGAIAGIPISSINLLFEWDKGKLVIPESKIISPDSEIKLAANWGENASATLEGRLNLALFQPAMKKYGKLSGLAGFSVIMGGKAGDPWISGAFTVNNFGFNEIYFDSIAGGLGYHNKKIMTLHPLLFNKNNNQYSLSGNVEHLFASPQGGKINLELKAIKADLSFTYDLIDKIRGEVVSRLPGISQEKTVKIFPSAISLAAGSAADSKTPFRVYSSAPKDVNPLSKWQESLRSAQKIEAALPKEKMGGILTGNVKLFGPIDNPSGSLEAAIDKGFFRNVLYDKLAVAATLKNRSITFEKFLFNKDGGNFSLSGRIGFDGGLTLEGSALRLPFSILRAVFPNKEFSGTFNAQASVSGKISSPNIGLRADGRNISLGGIKLDQFNLSFSKAGDVCILDSLTLVQDKNVSALQGRFSASDQRLQMSANLKKNAVGLVTLFSDHFAWEDGDAALTLEASGALSSPNINGRLTLSNVSIKLPTFDSRIKDLNGILSISNSLLTTNSLTALWVGKKTREIQNPIGIAGTLDLRSAFSEQPFAGLNLAFSNTRLSVKFPGVFTGGIETKELTLTGPIAFDLSQGPALKGNIKIDDAIINLLQSQNGGAAAFPLNLGLNINFEKNVHAILGDNSTINLSNIMMDLEIGGKDLIVSGNLSSPVLSGKVSLKRGRVNVFNRELVLLNPEGQKKYFPYDSEKIEENTAIFMGNEGANGIMPRINLLASIDIEESEKGADGKTVKKDISVLAKLKGTMGAKNENQGLKIQLSSFVEDKTKSPAEMAAASYSEEQLKVMLLPDFIKSLVGISVQDSSAVNTNAIVADYLSSRLQNFIFRGLERQLEQNLGLESLTLEYNLGPQMREALGVNDVKGFENTGKPAWTVGFVKGFFDRLYIDVRYSQNFQPQSTTSQNSNVFNYQLTYKFTPIWSIIYYREPININDLTNGYQKVTLKAGLSLW